MVVLSEFVAAESLAFFVFAGALLLEGTLPVLLLFAIEV